MQLTKNFTYEEFACQCGCGFNAISSTLVDQLQELRDELGASITIDSGCRCLKHNTTIGGEPHSQHLLGAAADIKVSGITTKTIYDLLDKKYPNSHGLGLYATWVHIDVRENKARWSK